MNEKQSQALVEVVHILVNELRRVERRFEALRAFVVSTSQAPSRVEEALDLGVSTLRTIDPHEESFRQLDAALELLKAGKKPDEMDG